jgi:hypothetical protein
MINYLGPTLSLNVPLDQKRLNSQKRTKTWAEFFNLRFGRVWTTVYIFINSKTG